MNDISKSRSPLGAFGAFLRRVRSVGIASITMAPSPQYPEALREFMELISAAEFKSFGRQDRLLLPSEAYMADGKLVFLAESQDVFRCGVEPLKDSSRVFISRLLEQWELLPYDLEPFLATFGFRECLFGSTYWANGLALPDNWRRDMDDFRLFGPAPYIWEDCTFFERDGVLVMSAAERSSGVESIWFGSQSAEQIKALRECVEDWNLE